jgi:hypothetical protein
MQVKKSFCLAFLHFLISVRYDAPFAGVVSIASAGLHLAPHHVVDGRAKKGEVQMTSCVDLEGHLARDGRFYLLDFSRSFPCAFKSNPSSTDRFWMYYHLFRAEFLVKWNKPLCADSFSPFMSRQDEDDLTKQDVIQATRHLQTSTVKTVAHTLTVSEMRFETVGRLFHRSGLNMRYLGLVLAELSARSTAFRLIAIEILGRVTKVVEKNFSLSLFEQIILRTG